MARTQLPHRLVAILAVCSALAALPPALFAQADDETVVGRARTGPLSPEQRIHHVLSRFTMGATPELFEEVRQVGIDAWFEKQLEGALVEDAALIAALAKLPSLVMTNQEILKRYVLPIPDKASIEELQRLNSLRNEPRNELLLAVLLRSINSKNQVLEVSSDIFRNHLAISVDKDSCLYFSTEYERDVIRANALGVFGDMLIASAKHPAMLVYLDNAVSRRPPSKAEVKEVARRVRQETKSKEMGMQAAEIAGQRGLNENYARELLELHTLGVDRYYTQADVVTLAEALTGWTYNGNDQEPVVFCFRGDMHVDGAKRFLGKALKGDSLGTSEGDTVLEMLVTHQGTARFLTWKLCRHLVNDYPDEAMVERVEKVFWKSRGDLKQVYRAILADPLFFDRANYQTKFKRPYEFVVSALRVTGAEITDLGELQNRIIAMSEPYYRPADPTGFYDQAEAWQDPGAIAIRWKFALDLASGRVRGVTIPASLYDILDPDQPNSWKRILADRIVPGGMSARTSMTIDRMVASAMADNPFAPMLEIAPKILGALLGSPDFQKQ